MTNIHELNRALKSYDSCLYAKITHPPRVDIYRKSAMACNPPHYIFSLTEDFKQSSPPVWMGIDVVLNRIKAIDIWRDDSIREKILQDQEKAIESKERDRRNSIESFLYDFRRQFAKATDGVNTSTLNKIYREESNGTYQSR